MAVKVFLTYPKQSQVHLNLGNPSADTASHSEAKRDRAKGIFRGTAIAEPPFRYKCVRLWERVLISANGIVSKRERRLKEQQEIVKNKQKLLLLPWVSTLGIAKLYVFLRIAFIV